MRLLSGVVLVLFLANFGINIVLQNWPATIGWFVATLLQVEKIVRIEV
jgi:hypothetical protein